MANKFTTAVLLTGAAARISQEVAFLDQLMEKKGLEINQETTQLAGFSSGSLNILALNACFRNDNPLDWNKDYKEGILFPLTNEKVYTKHGGIHVPVFDTAPLRVTLNSFLNEMGVEYFGDLAFNTYVLTFSERRVRTEWARSTGVNMQQSLNASDLFMASTAIPIAFPAQTIAVKEGEDRNFPKHHFADGGTGGQFKRFEEHIGQDVLANGPYETLHIISPMREEGAAAAAELEQGFNGHTLQEVAKERVGHFASKTTFGAFLKFLKAIQTWQLTNGPLATNVYVNIPRLESNYGILDFNKEKEQYDAVVTWINENPDQLAVPLDVFVNAHDPQVG